MKTLKRKFSVKRDPVPKKQRKAPKVKKHGERMRAEEPGTLPPGKKLDTKAPKAKPQSPMERYLEEVIEKRPSFLTDPIKFGDDAIYDQPRRGLPSALFDMPTAYGVGIEGLQKELETPRKRGLDVGDRVIPHEDVVRAVSGAATMLGVSDTMLLRYIAVNWLHQMSAQELGGCPKK